MIGCSTALTRPKITATRTSVRTASPIESVSSVMPGMMRVASQNASAVAASRTNTPQRKPMRGIVPD